jgi:hypothetical protein
MHGGGKFPEDRAPIAKRVQLPALSEGFDMLFRVGIVKGRFDVV